MSFNWLGAFRVGSYLVFRRFVAHELRDVGARIKVINAELSRIGHISIKWKLSDVVGDPLVLNVDEDDDDETVPITRSTEDRLGLSISGPGTTIAKLVRAYVAAGGNPFDISMFLDPREGVVVTADDDTPDGFRITWTHPSGGVVFPRTRETVGGGSFLDLGGTLSIDKSLELRVGLAPDSAGTVLDHSKSELNAGYIRKARDWISQEVREKRNDLEWRILKQMDLREQLRSERDHLLARAANGVGIGVPYNPDAHALDLSVPAILRHFDDLFFELKDDIPQIGFMYERTGNTGRSPPHHGEGRKMDAQNLSALEWGGVLWHDTDPDAWTGL
jgi:hypothetical protein